MVPETLSGVDAAWLQMDRPVNTADVVAVLRLEGSLSAPWLRRLVVRRLLAHDRFRQRIVHGALGRPAWVDDAGFSLDRHLFERRIGPGAGALDAYVSAVASEPLDLAHPPWQIHLVHAPDGSAIVAKLHHCIADGFALVAVLLSLTDEGAEPPRRSHRSRAFRDLAHLSAPREALRAAARDPRRAAGLAWALGVMAAALGRMIALWPDPASALRRPLGGERRVACSRPFPLRAVRAAARARGATIHELLAAATAGALRGWLAESSGRDGLRDVRAMVPVNLRPAGGAQALGNEFGLVYLDLPVATPSVDGRIERVRARMQALRASADALVTYGVLWLLGSIPTALERLASAFFTTKASLVLTNVPGPRRRLALAGHRIERMMFWVPHPSSLGLGVSILSYAGEVVVGVRADAAVMPDPGRLVRLFEEELGAIAPELGADVRPRSARSAGPAADAAASAAATSSRPSP
jgi:diacylglycerol O-acyltransferase / wax synthase